MLEFLSLNIDEGKEILVTLGIDGQIIMKSLSPAQILFENRGVVMNGIAEAVKVEIPKGIKCHFSFLQETSVEITCNNGNGSFSQGIRGYGSSSHIEHGDLWACARAFTDWINKSNLINLKI